MIRIKIQTLALASLLTLPLATACSPGQSPTEPAFDDDAATAAVSASTTTLSSVTDESRRGRGGNDDGTKADDNNNNRGGKGNRGRGRGGNGGNDDGQRAPRGGQELEGAVTAVNGNTLTLANGVRVVVTGTTQWSGRGDLFTLDQVATSLAAGRHPRVEGRGTRQADGTILANTIKAEDEEDD